MKMSSSAAVDAWFIPIGGSAVRREGSMNASPTTMKTVRGRSFPIVSALTTQALCRMPRTLTQASAVVMPTSSDARGHPLVITGQ